VALVRERTIPTERPPPVGEVVPTFAGVTWSAQRVPTAALCFLDRSRYFFIQVAPQLTSRGWVDPVPDPLLLRKSGSAGNRTRDLCICSQKFWPLDHRGGLFLYQTSRKSDKWFGRWHKVKGGFSLHNVFNSISQITADSSFYNTDTLFIRRHVLEST